MPKTKIKKAMYKNWETICKLPIGPMKDLLALVTNLETVEKLAVAFPEFFTTKRTQIRFPLSTLKRHALLAWERELKHWDPNVMDMAATSWTLRLQQDFAPNEAPRRIIEDMDVFDVLEEKFNPREKRHHLPTEESWVHDPEMENDGRPPGEIIDQLVGKEYIAGINILSTKGVPCIVINIAIEGEIEPTHTIKQTPVIESITLVRAEYIDMMA